MAIKNNICVNCNHRFVCEKLKTLGKFDDENKGYLRVDITIDNCMDFLDTDDREDD